MTIDLRPGDRQETKRSKGTMTPTTDPLTELVELALAAEKRLRERRVAKQAKLTALIGEARKAARMGKIDEVSAALDEALRVLQ